MSLEQDTLTLAAVPERTGAVLSLIWMVWTHEIAIAASISKDPFTDNSGVTG